MPQTPAHVKGVINLREQVIPVIDLRLRFEMDTIAYNDQPVLGPTLRWASGDDIEIRVSNTLAEATTAHWHGADVPAEALLKEGFTEEEIREGIQVYKPVGCDKCTKGYRGRIGVFEVMPVTDAMGKLIMEGANAIQIRDLARSEGLQDLRASGLAKVKAGITSLEEINRVTKD